MIIPGNNEGADEEETIDFDTIDLYTIDLKTARNAVKRSACRKLVDNKVSVYHAELGVSITFNKAGIKECINQPFHSFVEKLVLIRDNLEEAIKLSKYSYDPEPPRKGNQPHVVRYHYLETVINGLPAFFNVQETIKGEYILYTITDGRRRGGQ
jgi:hypothetical protein